MTSLFVHDNWIARLKAQQVRLREPIWWFPYPFIFSFGFCLVTTGYLTLTTNQRLGNPSDVITFPAPHQRDSAIWLSITPVGQDIVVTTNDRRIFRWPQKIRSERDTAALTQYLKDRVAQEVKSAALLQAVLTTQTSVIIAADQRLKYLHLRPLVEAMARAGISDYGFETLSPRISAYNPSSRHEGSARE